MFRLIFVLIAIIGLAVSAMAQENDSASLAPKEPEELLVGLKITPPFIVKENNTYSGLFVDLWEEIAAKKGYTYRYKEYDLNGLLSAVENGEVDLCINPLTVTAKRLEDFDFLQPVYISSMAIVSPAEENWLLGFLSNFFSINFFRAILFLLLVLGVFGVLLWLAEKRSNKEQFRSGFPGFLDGLWWSAVTMTTVGYGDKYPTTRLGKLIAIVWMFTAIITISGFTAAISSALTVEQLETSINELSDLDELNVGTVGNSSTGAFLGSHGISFTSFETVEEGLEALEKGSLQAFVYDEPILRYRVRKRQMEQTHKVIPLPAGKQYYSFTVPHKHHELRKAINPMVLEIIQNERWLQVLSRYNLNE